MTNSENDNSTVTTNCRRWILTRATSTNPGQGFRFAKAKKRILILIRIYLKENQRCKVIEFKNLACFVFYNRIQKEEQRNSKKNTSRLLAIWIIF